MTTNKKKTDPRCGIEAIGHGGDPRTSLLGTEHQALGRSVGGGQELGEDSLIGYPRIACDATFGRLDPSRDASVLVASSIPVHPS